MSFDRNEFENLAFLARLDVGAEEMDEFVANLTRIIDFFEQLDQADTEGVVPMAHPLDMPQRLRDDIVTEQDRRAMYQGNAPQTDAGLYLVPRVIDRLTANE